MTSTDNIRIACNDNIPRDVQCINITEFWCIHREWPHALDERGTPWHVTHRQSGIAACKGIRRKADALKVVRALTQAATDAGLNLNATSGRELMAQEAPWKEFATIGRELRARYME